MPNELTIQEVIIMGYPAASELISSHRQVRRLSKKWKQKRYPTLKLRMLLAQTPDPNHSYRTMLSLFTIANDSIGLASIIFILTITFFPAAHFIYAGITAALLFSFLVGHDAFKKVSEVKNENSKDKLISIQNRSRKIISRIKDIRYKDAVANTVIFKKINEFDNYKDYNFLVKKKFDKDSFINNSKTFLSAVGAGFISTKFITVGFFLTFNFASPAGILLASGLLLYATTLTLLKNKLDQSINDHQQKIKNEKGRIKRCQKSDLSKLRKLKNSAQESNSNELRELKNSALYGVDVNVKLARNSSALFSKHHHSACAPSITDRHNSSLTSCFDKKSAKKKYLTHQRCI